MFYLLKNWISAWRIEYQLFEARLLQKFEARRDDQVRKSSLLRRHHLVESQIRQISQSAPDTSTPNQPQRASPLSSSISRSPTLDCLYLQWQLFKSETSHRDHRNPRISNLNCLPTIKTGLAFYFIETYTVSRCQQPDESPTYTNMAAFFWSLFCSFLTIPSRKRTPMGARKTEWPFVT